MLLLRTELLGCYSDQDFLAKLHCVRQAFEVGVGGTWRGPSLGWGAVGHTCLPCADGSWAHPIIWTSPPARSPPFLIPQGLLEDKSNQLFFGEVGRQMVTGLMTKAEKVAFLRFSSYLGFFNFNFCNFYLVLFKKKKKKSPGCLGSSIS